MSNEDNSPTADEYQDSVNTQELPEVINVDSDGEELDDLEKELGSHPFLPLCIIFLIPIFRGSKAKLEVPSIFVLQT
jgi:hypothetical protein